MFFEVVLFLCLFIGSGSSEGPNYRAPSVYTPVQYAPSSADQQQPQQQQQFLQFQPQYTGPFGPQQQQPYHSPAANFFQPQNPWPHQTPSSNSYYWLNSQPQQQQQQPSLVNYFQPQLPSYPPNSLIVIYYRTKAARKPASPVDQQQTSTAPRIESQPAGSNRYPNICKGDGIIRHPDDCLKFIRCRLSLRHHVYYYEERSCPQGLAFDPELETCNYQANVAACSQLQTAPAAGGADGFPQQTAQTLLTYHGEFAEPEKVGEESSASNPSMYMVDLPQPLSDSSEEANNQLAGNSAAAVDDEALHSGTADSSAASVPLSGKNADGDASGLKSPPPATKTVKKPVQNGTKKSPSRKVSTKHPSSGATKSGSTKSKPVVQEKEIVPARRTPQVETFSIGDSAENARMMLDNEDVIENADQQTAQQLLAKPTFQNNVNSNVAAPESVAPGPTTNHQPERSSVHYEDDAGSEEEPLASSV